MLNPSFVDLSFWNFCTILNCSVSFISSTTYSIKFLSQLYRDHWNMRAFKWFRKLKKFIILSIFIMQNFFWPLDVNEFDMRHWYMFNFSAKVAGWCASPIWLYTKKKTDIIISWALGICLKYLLVKYPIYFFHKISKFFFDL